MARLTTILALLLLPCLPAGAHDGETPPGVPFPGTLRPPLKLPTAPGHRTPTRPPNAPTPGSGGDSARATTDDWRTFWHLNRDRWIDRSARLRIAVPPPPERTPAPSAAEDPGAAVRARAIEALRIAAADSNADLASTALVALGKAGDAPSRELFFRLAEDPGTHRDVREGAILAAGLCGTPDDAQDRNARDRLTAIMEDGERDTIERALAALALGYLHDPSAVLALVAEVRRREPRPDVPVCAAIGLGLLSDEIVLPDLARWLSGPRAARERDDVVRAGIAAALGKLRSREAIPHLVKALADRDKDVRRQALLSLGGLVAEEDTEAIRALLRVVRTEADSVAGSWACVALGESGATGAADAILEVYEGADQARVPYAALSLGLLAGRLPEGPLEERIRNFLARELSKSGKLERTMALSLACGLAGAGKAKPKLVEILREGGSSTLRGHAAVALGMIGAKDALPHLRRALEDRGDPWMTWDVALALGLLADRETPPILAEKVRKGSSQYVRATAATAMGYVARLEEAEVLCELVANNDEPEAVRTAGAAGLGLLLDTRAARAVPVLARLDGATSPLLPVEALLLALSID